MSETPWLDPDHRQGLQTDAQSRAFARRREAQVASRAEADARLAAQAAGSWGTSRRPIRNGNVKMIIQWNQTSYWRTRDDRAIPINELDHEHLFNLVNWAVGNCCRLYEHYANKSRFEVHEAKAWLRDQPLFRAVAQEAIKREFTFPADTYGYLKAYLVDDVQVDPWADEAQKHQVEKLQSFVTADLHRGGPVEHDGRSVRPVDLD